MTMHDKKHAESMTVFKLKNGFDSRALACMVQASQARDERGGRVRRVIQRVRGRLSTRICDFSTQTGVERDGMTRQLWQVNLQALSVLMLVRNGNNLANLDHKDKEASRAYSTAHHSPTSSPQLHIHHRPLVAITIGSTPHMHRDIQSVTPQATQRHARTTQQARRRHVSRLQPKNDPTHSRLTKVAIFL